MQAGRTAGPGRAATFGQPAVDSGSFLVRAVEYLVREAGIRPFLGVGTGLPTADTTHEVAQRIAPETRIVHVGAGRPTDALRINRSPQELTRFFDGVAGKP